jgi:hypothetical protein
MTKVIVFGKLFDPNRQQPVIESEFDNERLFVATRENQTIFFFEKCDKAFRPKLHVVDEYFVLHWLEERGLDPSPVLQYLKVQDFKTEDH